MFVVSARYSQSRNFEISAHSLLLALELMPPPGEPLRLLINEINKDGSQPAWTINASHHAYAQVAEEAQQEEPERTRERAGERG